MRRALIAVGCAGLVAALAGCGQIPNTTNAALEPVAPVSHRQEVQTSHPVYPPVSYPSTTTRVTVPYPPEGPD